MPRADTKSLEKRSRPLSFARQSASAERETLGDKGLLASRDVGEVFKHFRESQIAALDKRIPPDEWEIDDERVEFVRRNRDAFRTVK